MSKEAAVSELDESENTENTSDVDDGDDTALTNTDIISTDNVGDPSVEINVQDLINELEADGLAEGPDKQNETRKRLEELMEHKRALRDLEDFDDYDV